MQNNRTAERSIKILFNVRSAQGATDTTEMRNWTQRHAFVDEFVTTDVCDSPASSHPRKNNGRKLRPKSSRESSVVKRHTALPLSDWDYCNVLVCDRSAEFENLEAKIMCIPISKYEQVRLYSMTIQCTCNV